MFGGVGEVTGDIVRAGKDGVGAGAGRIVPGDFIPISGSGGWRGGAADPTRAADAVLDVEHIHGLDAVVVSGCYLDGEGETRGL